MGFFRRLICLSSIGSGIPSGDLGFTAWGLAAGNPKRTTARPTTEAMLEAFKGIDLALVSIGGQTFRHITPLSEVQKKILASQDLPLGIYSRLASPFSESTKI